MTDKYKKEASKLIKRISKTANFMPGSYTNWYLIEKYTYYDDIAIMEYNEEIGQDIIKENIPVCCSHEVHRDPQKNNFIISSFSATGKAVDVGIPKYVFTDVIRTTDKTAYQFLINALNESSNTIVYWYKNHGEESRYDIYFDAWEFPDSKSLPTPAFFYEDYFNFKRDYLQTRMQATGLNECKYPYKHIRKEIVYPAPFLWEEIYRTNPAEYKAIIEDRNIPDLINKCYDAYYNKDINKAVELYETGKYTFDEIYAITNVRGWDINKELKKRKNNQ